MARRPQPNPRRGIARAVGIVVLLLAIAIGILLVASVLTANTAKAPTAPTAPPTPGPITRTTPVIPRTLPTPGRAVATPTSVRATVSTPTPTSQHHHAALGSTYTFGDRAVSLRSPNSNLPAGPASTSRDGSNVAWIGGPGDAYMQNPLHILRRSSHIVTSYPGGDRFVSPVWSPDGASLLFVRVMRTFGIPGARWTLFRLDLHSGSETRLLSLPGLDMIPLGWSHGRILLLLSTAANANLWGIRDGRASFVTIVVPQVITGASLSPDGNTIAFGAGANCAFCTLNLYDVPALRLWNGPTGMPNAVSMAWTPNSDTVAVPFHSGLLTLDVHSRHTATYIPPAAMPTTWSHSMRAVLHPNRVILTDTVTGHSYIVRP